MKKKLAAWTAAAVISSMAAQAHAQDSSEFTVTTGVDYSSGDYGTGVDTDILVVPVAARLVVGDVRLSASIPYLRINGAEDIVGGDGGPIVGDPNSPRVIRDGIGDLSLGVNYGIDEDALGFGFDLGARVKLPTAAAGLGTGKTDLSFSAELSKSFGPIMPFISGGYRVLGDPDNLDLQNGFSASAGASIILGESVLLASYDYREATSLASEESQELFGALSTPLSDTFNLTIYRSRGLSDGAPDLGAGATISIRMF